MIMCSVDRLFVFGAGYTGTALVRRVREAMPSCHISVTTRSPSKCAYLVANGLADDAHVLDSRTGMDFVGRQQLHAATHVVVSVPPDECGVDAAFIHHVADLRQASQLVWLGYLSSTGVYGDHQGEWVDEHTRVCPGSSKATRRHAVEQQWLSEVPVLPTHVFRLAGIYGPGRSAIDTVRRGARSTDTQRAQARSLPGSVASSPQWVSRVHVLDVCGVLVASMQRPRPATVYNVADNSPATREDVLAFAACLARVTSFVDPGRLGRDRDRRARTDNKRVCNTRVRAELGYDLQFPDYRTGLCHVLAQEKPEHPPYH